MASNAVKESKRGLLKEDEKPDKLTQKTAELPKLMRASRLALAKKVIMCNSSGDHQEKSNVFCVSEKE